MAWLFFALAAGAIWIAFSTFSIGLAAVCLLAALGLIIAGSLMLISARISSRSQNPARMLDAKAMAAIRQRSTTPTPTAGSESVSRKDAPSKSADRFESDAAGGDGGGAD